MPKEITITHLMCKGLTFGITLNVMHLDVYPIHYSTTSGNPTKEGIREPDDSNPRRTKLIQLQLRKKQKELNRVNRRGRDKGKRSTVYNIA